MKIPRLLAFGLLSLILTASGCSDVAQEAQHSDGLFDFVGALLVGQPRKDAYPVRRVSGKAGEILTAHAEATRTGEIYVSGTLKNGFGYDDIWDAHVDVEVFGPDRRLLIGLATDYSPRPIPRDYRGFIGRATFGGAPAVRAAAWLDHSSDLQPVCA